MSADGCNHYTTNKITKSDYSQNCQLARTILVMVGIIYGMSINNIVYEKLVVTDYSMN